MLEDSLYLLRGIYRRRLTWLNSPGSMSSPCRNFLCSSSSCGAAGALSAGCITGTSAAWAQSLWEGVTLRERGHDIRAALCNEGAGGRAGGLTASSPLRVLIASASLPACHCWRCGGLGGSISAGSVPDIRLSRRLVMSSSSAAGDSSTQLISRTRRYFIRAATEQGAQDATNTARTRWRPRPHRDGHNKTQENARAKPTWRTAIAQGGARCRGAEARGNGANGAQTGRKRGGSGAAAGQQDRRAAARQQGGAAVSGTGFCNATAPGLARSRNKSGAGGTDAEAEVGRSQNWGVGWFGAVGRVGSGRVG